MAPSPGEETRVKVPLSLMQQEMWELESWSEPGSYNVTGCLRLRGAVDREALRQALHWLVGRHEPLRTSFPTDEGGPYQSIAPSTGPLLTEADLRALPPDRRADERVARLRACDAVPFDIAAGPLVRAVLLLLAEAESELVLTLHHMIADETAVHILISEMDEAYSAIAGGGQPALAPLPLQFADYALWERGWFDEARQQDELAYLVGRLEGASAEVPLPYDRPPVPTEKVYDVSLPPRVYQLTLPPEVEGAVTALARQCRATPFMVAMASVAALLAASSGRDDLVVSTIVTGRDRPELDRVLGDFSRMGLLRCDVTGDPPFGVLLERVRNEVLGLIEHQHVSVLRVWGALREQWAGLTTVAYPVDVQFFHAARDRWVPGTSVVDTPPTRAEHVDEDIPAAAKPLSFVFYGDGVRLWLRLRYQSECFDPSTIEALVADLVSLMAAAGRDPARRVSDLAGEVALRRREAT